MARSLITSRIDLSGPFFSKDPAKTFTANVRELLQEVADAQAEDVRQQYEAGEGARVEVRALGPGRVSSRIRGRVESLSRKPWHFTAVVVPDRTGLNAKQAIALFAAAAKVEKRIHAFARTSRKSKTYRTDLAKGLE